MTKFLISLKEGISEVLGDNLIGVHIHGSLALGGFNCKTSDIDFVVLTKEILSSKDFELLKTFHKKLAEKYPKFGNRLEGSYITKFMLSEKEPPDYPRPYLNGNQFIWAKYEYE